MPLRLYWRWEKQRTIPNRRSMKTMEARKRRKPFGFYVVLLMSFTRGTALIVTDEEVLQGLARVLAENVDLDLILLILNVIVAIAFLLLIVGIWRRRRWAWEATMIMVGVGLAAGLVRYLRG